jgi:hypothetical protein
MRIELEVTLGEEVCGWLDQRVDGRIQLRIGTPRKSSRSLRRCYQSHLDATAQRSHLKEDLAEETCGRLYRRVNVRIVWLISTSRKGGGHFAVIPSLIRRLMTIVSDDEKMFLLFVQSTRSRLRYPKAERVALTGDFTPMVFLILAQNECLLEIKSFLSFLSPIM